MSSYLITGAARGLGLAMATLLAANSSSEVSLVIATARKASPALEKLVQESSGRVIVLKVEVTDEKSIQQAAAEVEGIVKDKGLDVLINNAGVMNYTPDGIETMYAYLTLILTFSYHASPVRSTNAHFLSRDISQWLIMKAA